jgi:glycosyltransferase involved in cell wall biosynthesis
MKTNILQLVGSFHQGGSERQAVQLIRLLHGDEGYNIFPSTLNAEGVLRKEIENLGYGEIPEFPLTSFYDANMVRQIRRCAKYLRENDIEIIQTHDYYSNIFGMFAGTLARTPVRIAAKRDTGTKTSKQEFIERRAYNLANAIVVNAEAVRNHIVKKGVSPDKINVIYNGLDLERLTVSGERSRKEILESFRLPTGKNLKFVTIVANMRSDVKNHPMFLQAAKKVREKFENVRFILAGEGELTDRMKGLASEFGIEKDTFFIGRCENVAELLAVSDICVLSSKTEGFSNSILEYMAAAKPVVATDVGGASEAILEGETGFLVDSNDDETLADRLKILLEDPKKAEIMGKMGRKVVEDKFSLEAQLKKTLKLYKNLSKR